MTIDEAIEALQKAKKELVESDEDKPSLVLALPTHTLWTNVVDFRANKEDNSVRVIVKLYGGRTNADHH